MRTTWPAGWSLDLQPGTAQAQGAGTATRLADTITGVYENVEFRVIMS